MGLRFLRGFGGLRRELLRGQTGGMGPCGSGDAALCGSCPLAETMPRRRAARSPPRLIDTPHGKIRSAAPRVGCATQ